MTIRQILNRIISLTTLAAQCIAQGARKAAIEFYNLIYGYELRLMAAGKGSDERNQNQNLHRNRIADV